MPKKKTKKTSKPKASKSFTKVNKSAWIRSQPATTSAKDVVAKAKAEGITLSVAQVYTTRSEAKKRAGKKKASKAGGKRGQRAASSVKSDDLEFKRLVLSIGLAKAEGYLADLKRSVGL